MSLHSARSHRSLVTALVCLLLFAGGCASSVLSIAERNWIEVRSEHFVLIGDAPEDEVKRLAVELEKFHALLVEITNASSDLSRGPTVFYLFNDTRSYRQLAPRGSAGYFSQNLFGTFRVVSLKDMNARRVAYHEYVHHLLHFGSSLHYPLWYGEGLAEFLSTAFAGRKSFRVGGAPYPWIPWVGKTPFYSLEWLMQLPHFGGMTGKSAQLFYMQSWVLVHYLHGGDHLGMAGRRHQVVDYIGLLNQGESEENAFDRAFDVSRDALLDELRQYIDSTMVCHYKGWCTFGLPTVRIPLSVLEFVEDTSSRAVSKQEMTIRLGDLALFARLDGRRARALYLQAVRDDPKSFESRFGLILSLTLLGKYDAARVNAEMLLAEHPERARAPLAAGLIGIEEVVTRREEDEDWVPPLADTQAIRRQLRETLRIDPADVVALAALGETYTWYEDDLEPGIAALERALELAGWDAWAALNLAKLYVADGEPERARPLLEHIVQWSHHGGFGEEAGALLEELDESNP